MAEKSTQQNLRSHDINEKLIASIDNGILILDNELRITYFNKWLELHTSIKEKDVLGKNIDVVFDNINTKTLQRKIKTALSMGTPTFYSANITKYLIPIKINQIKISDFEHMRQDVSVIPFDIENKLIALIITDQTNITNTNKKLEANIKKIHELNLELIKERETIDERVILIKIDKNNTIADVSHAYKKLFDLGAKDIIGKNIFDYEKSTITNKLQKNIMQHIEKKQVLKYEKKHLDLKGKEVWLFNTLVPEYDKEANHIGFIIFSENITSAKLVQKHHSKLLENSRASAMGEMISMIAHQWRQPLSVINTLIATLKIKKELKTLDDSTINESYQKIEKTINYLSETIDDFRNYFKKNKDLQTFTIKNTFDKANHLLLTEMEMLNIEYKEDIDVKLEITTYQNELVQTIINILKNSMDEFKNKQNQYIHVKVYELNEYIKIEINDNAGGCSEEVLAKAFEPYFSTKSKNGTGLGLYLCKTIIEEHMKGKITMTSEDIYTKTIIKLPKILYIEKEL